MDSHTIKQTINQSKNYGGKFRDIRYLFNDAKYIEHIQRDNKYHIIYKGKNKWIYIAGCIFGDSLNELDIRVTNDMSIMPKWSVPYKKYEKKIAYYRDFAIKNLVKYAKLPDYLFNFPTETKRIDRIKYHVKLIDDVILVLYDNDKKIKDQLKDCQIIIP